MANNVEICAVGGYGEVGKNMTAIRVDDEVVICDMGIHLPNWISFTNHDDDKPVKLSRKSLINNHAIPDDRIIDDWRKKVIGIVPSHAHLDHVGAIPYLAPRYDAPIYGTPFTIEVIKTILKDEKIKLPNEIIPVSVNSKAKLSDKITIELIHMTHSTPHTASVLIHTPYGIVIYGSDFKLDNSPTLGRKPNYKALEKAGEKGVICTLLDTLYAHENGKTASEFIAREMLRETMLGQDYTDRALIITTFSSHIARLKSIVEFSQKLNRKPIFLGRSLAKYAFAAQDAGIFNFSDVAEIVKYGRQVRRRLKQIEKEKDKYVIIMTGHQGETNAVLSRIADGKFSFRFDQGDSVIFSCNVIPAKINIENRRRLDEKLERKGVRLFTGVHVSGHGCKEDLRTLIELVKSKSLIPMHSQQRQIDSFMQLVTDCGYVRGKTAFPLLNTQRITII